MQEIGHKTFLTHAVIATLVSAAALLLVVAAGLFIPLFINLGSGAEPTSEVQHVADRLLFLHENFWPIALTSLIAPCIACYVLFRRMTQPLVRFRGVYAQVATGAIPRDIKLREGDYLEGDGRALNAMLADLRGRAAELECVHSGLRDVITELQESLAAAASDPLPALASRLIEHEKHLDEHRLRIAPEG